MPYTKSSNINNELVQYQNYVKNRLEQLTPVFSKAAVGDFSAHVPIGDQEDELSEFFVGVQIILDAIREKIIDLETSVTDLQAANNIIVTEKARVQAILDGLGEGVVTVDQFGHTNYINQPAIALLGDYARVVGQDGLHTLRLYNENNIRVSQQDHPLYVALQQKQRFVASLTSGPAYYTKDLQRRISVVVTPIVQAEKTIGAAVALRDITEESNMDKAKSEIVSIASHQLRTPLTAIKWYVSALMNNGQASQLSAQRTEQYLRRIHDANQHMVELVDALLNVSRIDLGTLHLRPKDVDFSSVLNRVCKELAVDIRDKNIKMDISYDSNLRSVHIDSQALHIIVQNVVSNAVKYSYKDGNVSINVQQHEKNVLVSVKDNGCGIPQTAQHKIFTKLFRAPNAANVTPDGTGLGLYITKAMLERAGGAVWFESEENSGSTFYVIIPSMHKREENG